MKDVGFISSGLQHLNLPRDLKRQIQSLFGRLAADDGCLLSADALNEMLQLQLEWLFLGNGHRLTNNPFASKLADHTGVFGREELLQQRTLSLAFPCDAINESFLRPAGRLVPIEEALYPVGIF